MNQEMNDHIAVIGMAAHLPGAENIDQFWQNLCAGVESLSLFRREELRESGFPPELLCDEGFVAAKGIVEAPEMFDAGFFGFNPREAEITDPQHRLFLQCAWEALEHSGLDPDRYDGLIGVYAGASMNTYLANLLCHPELVAQVGNFQLGIGNDKDFLATRVSYKLNLKGPSFAVQCGCSTALVAVHLACQSILDGQCDMALAGGVALTFPNKSGYVFREGGVFSPDGHCRTFDAQAQGTVPSNGVGIVVLARLQDALAQGHTVYAVIKGSAINNDGSTKVGYTAPSDLGQTEVIATALALANIPIETIGYVEAHGTATQLGDPIELAALTRVFQAGTSKTRFCGLGSVKTNIGHLDTAAGIAGLIKVIMALRHQKIPPSLHFVKPNPNIDFTHSPFYVNTQLKDWKSESSPRRAGVSSFGIGGTNAHVVVEEFTHQTSGPGNSRHLLVLSARTQPELEKATDNLAAYLSEFPDVKLADVAFTLHMGRKAFSFRRAVDCENGLEAAALLNRRDPLHVISPSVPGDARKTVFMFPGQGAQYVRMGEELYCREPVFRREIDRCAEFARAQMQLDLREILYPPADHLETASERLGHTAITQPALFMVEHALAEMWKSYGVLPEVVIGHSLGEFTAACIAGVFSLEDALRLVILRGALAQKTGKGRILMVSASEAMVKDLIRNTDLSLAAINRPDQCVIAGSPEAIAVMHQSLALRDIECRLLESSTAFHSSLMDPVKEEFVHEVAKVQLHKPRIPYISCLTGKKVEEEATRPEFWGAHLRDTVRFAEAIATLGSQRGLAMLEAGPGKTLATLTKHQPQFKHKVFVESLRHPKDQQSDSAFLLKAMGRLWTAGIDLDWGQLYAGQQRRRISLPKYPFTRQRYWVERSTNPSAASEVNTQPPSFMEHKPMLVTHERPQLRSGYKKPDTPTEEILAGLWEEFLGVKPVGTQDNFFEIGGDSIVGLRIAGAARQFDLHFSAAQIFECQTIEDLAKAATAVARGSGAGESSQMPSHALLAPMQHWFFQQNFPHHDFWNQCILLEMRQRLSGEQLQSVFRSIFAPHEALHLRFAKKENEWTQVHAGDASLQYQIEDLSDVPPSERTIHIERISAEAQAGLDISRGPLMRVVSFSFDGAWIHRVLIVIHHLVADIISWRVLLEDLAAECAALELGTPVLPMPPTNPFTTWCHVLSEYSRSIGTEEILNYSRSVMWRPANLPLDNPAGTNDVASAARLEIQLSVEETGKTQKLCARHHLQPQQMVLGVIVAGLSRWTGERFFLFTLERDGREIPLSGVDVTRTAGWFTVSYPALLQVETSQDALQHVLHVKEQSDLIARRNPAISLLRCYHEDAKVRQELAKIPEPEISFLYLGHLEQMLSDSARFVLAAEPTGPLRSPGSRRPHVLDFEARIADGRLSIACSYSSNLHRSTTIAGLMDRIMAVLLEAIRHVDTGVEPLWSCSDFPEADLSPEELNHIVATLRDR